MSSLNIIKRCHSKTHCAVNLPHLTYRTHLNTVLGAGAFCLQTAITDVVYVTFQRHLAIGNTLSISAHCNRLTFCESCPCVSANGFCNNAKILKKFYAMADWWRNALLILHYPTVICTVFCSYLGTVLTNGNE